jgi:hypothetical protein
MITTEMRHASFAVGRQPTQKRPLRIAAATTNGFAVWYSNALPLGIEHTEASGLVACDSDRRIAVLAPAGLTPVHYQAVGLLLKQLWVTPCIVLEPAPGVEAYMRLSHNEPCDLELRHPGRQPTHYAQIYPSMVAMAALEATIQVANVATQPIDNL